MSALGLIGCAVAVVLIAFLLGALTGNHLLTRHQRRRSRQIAQAQRAFNERARASSDE